MSRYIADQNKVVLLHESGTYAVTSGNGVWLGQVQEVSIDDAENKLVSRYLGTANRNYATMELGPRDVTGTLSYNAQDMRIPFWAIGSVYETSGTSAGIFHIATETNNNVWQSPFTSGTGQITAPISFAIEDSKTTPGTGTNFVRTIKGIVPNSVTITATQGEKVLIDVDWIGQTLSFTSGTTTSVTQITNTPYLWNNCALTLGGSVISTAREVSLQINNNAEAPHYVNGSRDIGVPFYQNRDYTLNVTMDLASQNAKMLYETYYKSNGSFNAVFDLNADIVATGSQHAVFVMSGCRITSMENPSTIEGATESTIEIRPTSITGSEWNYYAVKFNPW